MSWKLYEHKVLEKLRDLYPNSEVQYNTAIRGVKSVRSRQIDTLITQKIGNAEIKTVVDSKCFGKKINIKTVESFIGFLSDVGADRGIIVTQIGYSKSAKKRTENEKTEIELRILSIDELPDFVGFYAVMKYGPVDCWFEAHPKWIINSKNPTLNALAKIYPNKYDWNKAVENNEYIYGTILVHVNKEHKLPDDFNYEDISKRLNKSLFEKHPSLKEINISSLVDLDGAPVPVHACIMDNISEYLAAAHYDEYSILFGLVTPNKNSENNLDALRFTASHIKTMFTTRPGMPNLSEMFVNFKTIVGLNQKMKTDKITMPNSKQA